MLIELVLENGNWVKYDSTKHVGLEKRIMYMEEYEEELMWNEVDKRSKEMKDGTAKTYTIEECHKMAVERLKTIKK